MYTVKWESDCDNLGSPILYFKKLINETNTLIYKLYKSDIIIYIDHPSYDYFPKFEITFRQRKLLTYYLNINIDNFLGYLEDDTFKRLYITPRPSNMCVVAAINYDKKCSDYFIQLFNHGYKLQDSNPKEQILYLLSLYNINNITSFILNIG